MRTGDIASSGAGALAPDADQAAGKKQTGRYNDEPDQRNWGAFGLPIFYVGAYQ